MQTKKSQDNTVSGSSQEISEILHAIGFEHECEVPPHSSILGGMMAIDFACKTRMVAIEYDGETHFLQALESGEFTVERNGTTKAKRQLLQQLGWTVINLDYRHWREACDKQRQEEWLRRELKKADVMLY